MLDGSREDDQVVSVAFLDGFASSHLSEAAIDRRRLRARSPRRITPINPAASVMTDFTWDAPVTVPAERYIDEALRDMIVAGVRALLVTRGEAVVGLITSYDIQGERPIQFLNSSGFTRHSEIEVGHIMTPWPSVPTIDVPWVSSASVSDVVDRFRRCEATHFVVVEYSEQGGAFVRGMFSRTELGRQLGQSI
jgi:CBS domain-containing protein